MIVDQMTDRFPPYRADMLVVASFGSGLLFQEFTHISKLIQACARTNRSSRVQLLNIPILHALPFQSTSSPVLLVSYLAP